MKYLYTNDYEGSFVNNGVRVNIQPGEIIELTKIPNRLVNHLVPVTEDAPVVKTPPKKTKKKKKLF